MSRRFKACHVHGAQQVFRTILAGCWRRLRVTGIHGCQSRFHRVFEIGHVHGIGSRSSRGRVVALSRQKKGRLLQERRQSSVTLRCRMTIAAAVSRVLRFLR